MKTTIALIAATLALAACSTPVLYDEDMRYMSRTEVSQAIADCEGAEQRASIQYVRSKWKGNYVNVPVDVTCVPSPRITRWGSATR